MTRSQEQETGLHIGGLNSSNTKRREAKGAQE